MTPLQLLGVLCVFAVARVALSTKFFSAGDARSSAVAVVRDYLDALLVAGLLAVFVITFLVRTYYIPSISMLPTLAVRDVLLVDQISYRFRAPADGEIAVFTPPVPSQGNEFVKRVMGVPGDTIRIADGVVYRNGIALKEPYENQPPKYDLEIKKYGIYVDGMPLDPRHADIPPKAMWQAPDRIPKGFFFMLGDNRNYSEDSRVWGFAQRSGPFVAGPLAGSSTRAGFAGRAVAVVWPPGRFAALH